VLPPTVPESDLQLSPEAADARQFAHRVVDRLVAAGHQALLAGGCVRDQLLGIIPSDYDVATSATPQQVRELFGNRHTLLIGAAFGVVAVWERLAGQRHEVEVATFRQDAQYSDGRHPDYVTFSTPQLDAQRRDFTINGLFYDPLCDRVIDYVGGQADLQAGLIRAIGDPPERFSEDKLRMLRAVRFAGRFGFALEPQTEGAIRQLAWQIVEVSRERIAMEMRKMLVLPRRLWCLQRLEQTGLLAHIAPALASLWAERPELAVASQALLQAANPDQFPLALAALLYPLEGAGLTVLDQLRGEWRLSNQEFEQLQFALTSVDTLADAERLPWSRLQPLLTHRQRSLGLELLEAIVAAGWQPAGGLEHCRAALDWPQQQLDPPPLLTGQDLIAMGMKPSPRFARLLQQARELQLDQLLADRAAARGWLAERIGEEG